MICVVDLKYVRMWIANMLGPSVAQLRAGVNFVFFGDVFVFQQSKLYENYERIECTKQCNISA